MRQLRDFRSGLVRLFRGTSPAERRSRASGGLLVSVVMLPVLLGVMGCFELPAPIGDPERSRIEPAISGVWINNESDTDFQMLILEPFDRRTWLMRWVILDVDAEKGESALSAIKAGGAEIDGVLLFKVWRKRISGKSFFTMEIRGLLGSEKAMEPSIWWGARMAIDDNDRLLLQMIDKDFEELEAGMTRRELERVIRRNHDNPNLYANSEMTLLSRIPVADYDVIAELLDDFGIYASY